MKKWLNVALFCIAGHCSLHADSTTTNSSRSTRKVDDSAERAKEKARSVADEAKARAKALADQARERARALEMEVEQQFNESAPPTPPSPPPASATNRR